MIGYVPDADRGEAEPRVRSSIRAFDRLEHIFLCDGAERFFQRLERIAKIDDKFVARLRGARSALVAVRRRFFAVQLRRKSEVRAGHVFHLLAKRAQLFRTVPGINPAIVTLCGASAGITSAAERN